MSQSGTNQTDISQSDSRAPGTPSSVPAKPLHYSCWWLTPLLLPYIALLFPHFYAQATPTLLGFPFFYWYQFLWVILTSAILAAVYRKLKT